MTTIQNWLYWPSKKNWPNGKKIHFLLTFQIKSAKLTPCIQSFCKKHAIQAYYQKIDFIEKTWLSDQLNEHCTVLVKIMQSTQSISAGKILERNLTKN